jgi:hypothetical protein
VAQKYQWLDYDTGADYGGFTPRQLRQWVQDGRITSARLGLRVVFKPEWIDAFIEANTREAVR